MHFKRLEMFGFKSFADQTQVRLEQGITAIVGPNGCGKSNILDAVRWSLGEQNAREMRGTHMLDLIFNGSENRQATGMAEVSITFDNSDSRLPVDFAEVQVTRRLYRSGESEYFVNKTPCRLRDIHELFMDTGIGTNAYSMIGQGKIDMVLSSKPEDRRFLFEAAAGIIKYKARKKVAMRKLESAEHNLLRLSDVIAEVQRQMRSLKRQVNAAIRYREMKEQLSALEVRSLWLRWSSLTARVAELKGLFHAAQDAYEKAMAETTQFESRNEELALNRMDVERRLAARREEVREIDAEMEKADRQIALLRQQVDFLKEQQQQAIADQEGYQQRAGEIREQMAKTAEAAEALQAELAGCAGETEQCQQRHDEAQNNLADAEARLESARNRIVASMNDRAKAQAELESLGNRIQTAEMMLEGLYERRKSHAERNDALEAQLEQARGVESETLAAIEELAELRAQGAKDHAGQAQQLRDVHDERQRLRERKSSQEARLASLRELRDSYEGFAIGVRAVMMAKQRSMPEARGMIGPVGDLLSTEKTYERAIEAALGGNINNVVVEDADAAKAAIGFLKHNRAGRVTFLPLDTIRPGQNDESDAVLGKPGVIGRAIDHVTFDATIQKAVEYLLYNAVIVETLDDAIRIARSERRYPRLVTLDGEIVSSSGAVTGGQMQNESRGLLGRSAEIQELEEQVEQSESDLERLTADAERLAGELQARGAQLKGMETRDAGLRAQLNEIGVNIARFTTELQSLSRSAQQVDEETHRLEEERRRFGELQSATSARADEIATGDAKLQRALASAQDGAAEARQALAALGVELSELRIRHAGLVQRLEEAERNRAREQAELEEAQRSAARRVEQAGQFQSNEAALEVEIAGQIEKAKGLSDNREQAQKRVVEAQNEQETLLRENDGLIKLLRDLHDKTRAAQAEVYRLEMELRHDEDQLEFLNERVLTEYHIALGSLTAEQVGADEYDDETRDALVADLRDKLDRMGQVNLMAIEEYDGLEQRNTFLVTQEEDLRKAREALLGIVARIDKTTVEMFMETFQRVADHFRVFFRRLFNGGQARIYLLDESDPLESGIEIEARPPGKKPQGIGLLSGGEQALTAIALLFSIFKAKPSPFCVLDEVDAPLDDANIGRFLSLVEEFTNDSQFIIITHSKQTMARANVLYGVTMPERGVSQLVSVRFDEVPEAESAA